MASLNHRYYCTHCRIFLHGESLLDLAGHVNTHNTVHHPMDCASWTEKGITLSAHYDEVGKAQVTASLVKSSTILGLTPDDEKFLAEARVKW